MYSVQHTQAMEQLRELKQAQAWAALLEATRGEIAELADSTQPPAGELAYFLATAQEGLDQSAEALANYGLGFELLSECGDNAGALDCQIGLASVCLSGGSLGQAQHLARQAAAGAKQAGLELQWHRANHILGRALDHAHYYLQALPLLQAATAYFEQHCDRSEALPARRELAWCLIGTGQVAEGEALSLASLEQLEQSQAAPSAIKGELNTQVFAAWSRRDFERIATLQARMLELEAADPRPQQLMVLHYNAALTQIALERYQEAKLGLHRAWEIARRQGEQLLLAPLQMALALIAVHEDQAASAVEYAELARSNIRDQQSDETTLVRYYLALAYLANHAPGPAEAEWNSRRSLEPSIENALELQWLGRALAALADSSWTSSAEDTARVLHARMVDELLSELARER